MPNIVYSLGLTPYELTLYSVIRRTAGEDGTCWKSTETLAKECGMSTGSVSKSKQALTEKRPELNGKPLIQIVERERPGGGRPYHAITVVDIWPENMTRFSNSRHEQASSPDEVASSPHEQASSPGEVKKNPHKEKPTEEQNKNPANAGADAPQNSEPLLFTQWLQNIQKPPDGSNRIAQLKTMHDALFPNHDPVDYGRIGKTAQRVGGAGRLAQLLWESVPKRPNGSVCDYIEAMENGRKRRNGASQPGRVPTF